MLPAVLSIYRYLSCLSFRKREIAFNDAHMCSFGAQAILVLGSQQIVHWILVATTDWALHLGPYALLASSFVSFFSDIPALQHYKVLGLTVSDKVNQPLRAIIIVQLGDVSLSHAYLVVSVSVSFAKDHISQTSVIDPGFMVK